MAIKAGYLVQITSWENDGDNYKTLSNEGLSEAEARFIVKVAERFCSAHNIKGTKQDFWNLGNDFIDFSVLQSMLEQVAEETQANFPQCLGEIEDDIEPDEIDLTNWISEFLYDRILDIPEECYFSMGEDGQMFCRAVSAIKVFLVPQDIPEVSDKFTEFSK